MKAIGFVLIGLGILAGGATVLVSLALPSVTNNRVDFGEAVIGIVIGAGLLAVSIIALIIALIVMAMRTKSNAGKGEI